MKIESPRSRKAKLIRAGGYPLSLFSNEIFSDLKNREADFSGESVVYSNQPNLHKFDKELLGNLQRYLQMHTSELDLKYSNSEGRRFGDPKIFSIHMPCADSEFHKQFCLNLARCVSALVVSLFDLYSKNNYENNPFTKFDDDNEEFIFKGTDRQSSFFITVDNLTTVAQIMAMTTYSCTTTAQALQNLELLASSPGENEYTYIEQFSDTISGFWATLADCGTFPDVIIDGKVSPLLLECLKVLKNREKDLYHGGCPARFDSYREGDQISMLDNSGVQQIWIYMLEKIRKSQQEKGKRH